VLAELEIDVANMLNYPNKLPNNERIKLMTEYKTLKYTLNTLESSKSSQKDDSCLDETISN
jgi:hypothetical protein